MKSFYGVSGMGSFKWPKEKEKIKKELEKSELIFEPFVNVIKTYGTRINLKDNSILFTIENYINKKGGFVGGKIVENIPDKWVSCLKEIAVKYKDMGAKGEIQIDSFLYEKNGKEIFRPLVEVNYRKTMGQVVHALYEKLPKKRFHSLFIINKKFRDTWEKLEGVTIFSPRENKLQMAWFSSEDEDVYRKTLEILQIV